VRRPVGFSPWEISALVNYSVVSQHADEAAFLWTVRTRAVREPHYSLKDLVALDERVEAHLDGLRVAGDVGWDFCKDNLINDGPGDLFPVAVLAFGAGHRERMREALSAGSVSSKLRPGLIAALGWLDYTQVSGWLERLLESKSSIYRAIAIAACAVHREDPGAVLRAAVDDADPILRARALRCVGEIKRHDLLQSTTIHLADEDETCRFWAAWAVTLLGSGDGVPLLMRAAEEDSLSSDRAFQLGLRAIGLAEGRRWVSRLAREPRFASLVVIGAGIVGDPVSVPWLINRMESPALARLAGEAFTMITGIDLAYHDLSQDITPTSSDEEQSADEARPLGYETNLAWPSAVRVGEWWANHHDAFSSGIRYLGGKPITKQSLIDILIDGKQRLRAAAALELALLNRNEAFFEVRSRGAAQRTRLEQWIS
jgi:uncharacterized protein (TIGR02270 family)